MKLFTTTETFGLCLACSWLQGELQHSRERGGNCLQRCLFHMGCQRRSKGKKNQAKEEYGGLFKPKPDNWPAGETGHFSCFHTLYVPQTRGLSVFHAFLTYWKWVLHYQGGGLGCIDDCFCIDYWTKSATSIKGWKAIYTGKQKGVWSSCTLSHILNIAAVNSWDNAPTWAQWDRSGIWPDKVCLMSGPTDWDICIYTYSFSR